MPSLKQLEANRLNAQKSTGPRTPVGKAVSRFNALKSGIHAQSVCIPGEDPAELQGLAGEYYERFAPTEPEHRALVDSLVSNEWLLRRLRTVESQMWERLIDMDSRLLNPQGKRYALASALFGSEERFTALQRRIDSVDRAYHRALNQLRKLQETPLEPTPTDPEPAGRPLPEIEPVVAEEHSRKIGFVPPITAPAVNDRPHPDCLPHIRAGRRRLCGSFAAEKDLL